MPDSDGTQKCWQSIVTGLLGSWGKKETICPEEEWHCTVYETINCDGRGGNYGSALIKEGHCGKVRLLCIT